jgi:ABC-type dipeptide/oligopeptide/nickel transport system permease subunit
MGSGAYQLGKSPAQSERYSSSYGNRVRRIARRVNWPLLIGALITLFVILLAVFGPDWAPNDPMQENYALTVDGDIVRPPYSPFTLPGYPLGTDQFGRDLFSRLLYGVCLLYTSPSPRDRQKSRMPSSA